MVPRKQTLTPAARAAASIAGEFLGELDGNFWGSDDNARRALATVQKANPHLPADVVDELCGVALKAAKEATSLV